MDLKTAEKLTPKEYHARRETERQARREAFRERKLREAREAIHRIAPRYPAIGSVHLFGSLLAPGWFTTHSDIDVALECDDLEVETPFARELEGMLEIPVDLRPLSGPLVETVRSTGEKVYQRQDP
ncbi:MAG: nucleotidyltransferase domain-containing protein [Thermoanaerobaculia bacterium]